MNYYKNYKYCFLRFINYNWKLRQQFNYKSKKHNTEKIKIYKTKEKY